MTHSQDQPAIRELPLAGFNHKSSDLQLCTLPQIQQDLETEEVVRSSKLENVERVPYVLVKISLVLARSYVHPQSRTCNTDLFSQSRMHILQLHMHESLRKAQYQPFKRFVDFFRLFCCPLILVLPASLARKCAKTLQEFRALLHWFSDF